MSQRYTKIFILPKIQNDSELDIPVCVKAGSLLYDNEKKRMVSQLQFSNISPKSINSITVNILAYDATGTKIDGAWGVEYKHLIANPGDDFGETIAVQMGDNNAKAIEVDVLSVRFSDGSKWSKVKQQASVSAEVIKKRMADNSKEMGNKTASAAQNAAKKAAEGAQKVSDVTAAGVMKVGEGVIIGGNFLFRLVSVVISIAIFVALLVACGVAATFLSLGQAVDSIVAVCGLGLATLLAFPLFGKLLNKTSKPIKFRIIRWVVICLIVLLTCVGVVTIQMANEDLYEEHQGIWLYEGEDGQKTFHDIDFGMILTCSSTYNKITEERLGICKSFDGEVRILYVVTDKDAQIGFDIEKATIDVEKVDGEIVFKMEDKMYIKRIQMDSETI